LAAFWGSLVGTEMFIGSRKDHLDVEGAAARTSSRTWLVRGKGLAPLLPLSFSQESTNDDAKNQAVGATQLTALELITSHVL
jgi:hypothetical protein